MAALDVGGSIRPRWPISRMESVEAICNYASKMANLFRAKPEDIRYYYSMRWAEMKWCGLEYDEQPSCSRG